MGRPLTPNQTGAIWMLASVVCFTLEASLIKALSAHYPPTIILFWRQFLAVALLSPLIVHGWRTAFITPRPGLILFRSTVGTLGILLSIAAYARLPLADVNALSFTRTLWMVLLAGLVLREPVGPRRLIAAAIGFIGVVIMLRPGQDGLSLSWGHTAAIGAAVLAALTILSVKVMSRDHSVFTLTVYGSVLGLLLSAPLAVLTWVAPKMADLPLLIGLGVAGLGTLVCYTRGMQAGEAAVMAPIDYTRLVFAAAVGALVFSEPLTVPTVIGAVVIVASTLYLTLRRD